MISATQIPDLTRMSPKAAETWWQEMGELGLVFHPDDPPSEIVNIQSGEKSFSAEACTKLEGILQPMLDALGDQTYDMAHRELMKLLGWRENAEGNGWERTIQR